MQSLSERANDVPRSATYLRRYWPCLLLIVVFGVAWLVTVLPESALDGELPTVLRPTFSAHAPAAYRLAEPGDTLDKVGVYLSAVAIALSALGWLLAARGGKTALWPGALATSLMFVWESATPWPTYDGWHGLNWRAIGASSTPILLRILLSALAICLVLVIGRAAWRARSLFARGRALSAPGLFALAVAFFAWRVIGIPDFGPTGYWPRVAMIGGLIAWNLGLLAALPPGFASASASPRRLLCLAGIVCCTLGISLMGRWMIWYHRPLDRLRPVVPGRIYISAMPTQRGLDVEQRRLGFKTIINLFDENTPQRSPLYEAEKEFARTHNVRYVQTPGNAQADAFLDETLRIAQDPNAWPILVHCHGCMDRSPAWMGMYRFLVQERPIREILQEIEAHRGSRPKASVVLLYNWALGQRAPARYAADPAAQILRRIAVGAPNIYATRVAVRPSEVESSESR